MGAGRWVAAEMKAAGRKVGRVTSEKLQPKGERATCLHRGLGTACDQDVHTAPGLPYTPLSPSPDGKGGAAAQDHAVAPM